MVLSDNGYADLAFQLVTQTTYPGWGYMVKEGATTMWERWEYLTETGMNSQNHIMLGSVDAWFYRFLAGIQIDSSEAGWEIFSHSSPYFRRTENLSALQYKLSGG